MWGRMESEEAQTSAIKQVQGKALEKTFFLYRSIVYLEQLDIYLARIVRF